MCAKLRFRLTVSTTDTRRRQHEARSACAQHRERQVPLSAPCTTTSRQTDMMAFPLVSSDLYPLVLYLIDHLIAGQLRIVCGCCLVAGKVLVRSRSHVKPLSLVARSIWSNDRPALHFKVRQAMAGSEAATHRVLSRAVCCLLFAWLAARLDSLRDRLGAVFLGVSARDGRVWCTRLAHRCCLCFSAGSAGTQQGELAAYCAIRP